ncbi:MAG: hypothetical protein HY747_00305 [Elusimicrobia bacterium]|nr:hypothetical protein [Elusimicrobiota bacterium]
MSNQQKFLFTQFAQFAPLALLALSLGGCMTVRTAQFPGYDYDTVFKAAVAGACEQKKLIVFESDKDKGIVNAQTHGVWGGALIPIVVSGKGTNSPQISITMGGANNPWPDRVISGIKQKVGEKPAGKTSELKRGGRDDLDFEREKLELEKEKLKLEREKLKLEKEKQNLKK